MVLFSKIYTNDDFHTYARGMLLIGDSMIRHFDPEKTKYPLWMFSYPGITVSQVNQQKVHFQANNVIVVCNVM